MVLSTLFHAALWHHYPSSERNERVVSNRLMLCRTIFACLGAIMLQITASGAAQDSITQGPAITDLLKSGWQIAGYSQAFDNRSTFILFRHPEQTYLVQCRVGYDVTRSPSVYTICYELR
jgi:hypothetical protein